MTRPQHVSFLSGFGEGKIIVLFQNFIIFLVDLCVGTAPQTLGTTSQIIWDHSLSRPLVTLDLRDSRPGDPRFLLFVLFSFLFNLLLLYHAQYTFYRTWYCFSFNNITWYQVPVVLFFVYMPATLCSTSSLFAFCYHTYIPSVWYCFPRKLLLLTILVQDYDVRTRTNCCC